MYVKNKIVQKYEFKMRFVNFEAASIRETKNRTPIIKRLRLDIWSRFRKKIIQNILNWILKKGIQFYKGLIPQNTHFSFQNKIIPIVR